MAKKQISIEKALMEACNDDKDLALFFAEWLHNGKSAKLAYKKFHPNVTDRSAEVLGSRQLSKVDLKAFLPVYNLGVDRYYQQLDEALKADKWNDFTGEREPDHKTRLPYHDKLGNLLGIEKKQVGTQVNIQIPILGKDFGINVPDNNSNQKDS